MNALEWVKSNILIVVFLVLMIAAPVTMWFIASGMNASVKEDVKRRADNLPQIAKIKNTSIEVLGREPKKGAINERLISDFEKVAGVLSEDADAVRKAAIEHNRKGRTVLMPQVLPTMPPAQAEVLPQRFHEAVSEAYDKLLRDINAGMPPDLESLRSELERRRSTFITGTLQQSPEEKLNDEDYKKLTSHLSEQRLQLYSAAADNISLYIDRSALQIPEWQQTAMPAPAQLFAWQWQYWVASDVLKALADANKADRKVYRAPVKRVYNLAIFDLPGATATASGGSPARPGAGGFSGGGFSGGGRGAAMPDDSSMMGGDSGADFGGAPAVGGGGGPNPKAPVPTDFNASITGRKTNPLYDVVYVQLDMAVETGRLPQVIDALSQYNFFTVMSLNVVPADAYAAAREGFIFGDAPVSNVSMTLETIWLRDWTTPFMPDDLKQMLEIPVATPPSGENSQPPMG